MKIKELISLLSRYEDKEMEVKIQAVRKLENGTTLIVDGEIDDLSDAFTSSKTSKTIRVVRINC